MACEASRMNTTPKLVAARDQLGAAIRDRLDKHGADLHNTHDRLLILAVVGLIADAAMAFKGTSEDTAARRCEAISHCLESIVTVIENV